MEEELRLIPEFLDEVNTSLDERYHASQIVVAIVRHLHALCLEHRLEELSQLCIALAEDVFVVEPCTFLIVKLGTGLAAMLQREELDELVHRHQLLVIARVPTQQGEEVDDRFGQVACLTIARRDFTTLGVVPLQGEDGEAQAVAVALAQLSIALGLE